MENKDQVIMECSKCKTLSVSTMFCIACGSPYIEPVSNDLPFIE